MAEKTHLGPFLQFAIPLDLQSYLLEFFRSTELAALAQTNKYFSDLCTNNERIWKLLVQRRKFFPDRPMHHLEKIASSPFESKDSGIEESSLTAAHEPKECFGWRRVFISMFTDYRIFATEARRGRTYLASSAKVPEPRTSNEPTKEERLGVLEPCALPPPPSLFDEALPPSFDILEDSNTEEDDAAASSSPSYNVPWEEPLPNSLELETLRLFRCRHRPPGHERQSPFMCLKAHRTDLKIPFAEACRLMRSLQFYSMIDEAMEAAIEVEVLDSNSRLVIFQYPAATTFAIQHFHMSSDGSSFQITQQSVTGEALRILLRMPGCPAAYKEMAAEGSSRLLFSRNRFRQALSLGTGYVIRKSDDGNSNTCTIDYVLQLKPDEQLWPTERFHTFLFLHRSRLLSVLEACYQELSEFVALKIEDQVPVWFTSPTPQEFDAIDRRERVESYLQEKEADEQEAAEKKTANGETMNQESDQQFVEDAEHYALFEDDEEEGEDDDGENLDFPYGEDEEDEDDFLDAMDSEAEAGNDDHLYE